MTALEQFIAFSAWFEALPVPLWPKIVALYAAGTWALLRLNPRFWDIASGPRRDDE